MRHQEYEFKGKLEPQRQGVVKGSSASWVAKFKGDENSECKLSNGWSRSYREINCFFLQRNEWSRSYREINSTPIFHGTLWPMDFWTPPRFLRDGLWVKHAYECTTCTFTDGFVGNAMQFVHKFCFSLFLCPLTPIPPSQPAKWGISSWNSTRRAANRIANTQPKLRTNPPKIAIKLNYEQTGVSEGCRKGVGQGQEYTRIVPQRCVHCLVLRGIGQKRDRKELSVSQPFFHRALLRTPLNSMFSRYPFGTHFRCSFPRPYPPPPPQKYSENNSPRIFLCNF